MLENELFIRVTSHRNENVMPTVVSDISQIIITSSPRHADKTVLGVSTGNVLTDKGQTIHIIMLHTDMQRAYTLPLIASNYKQ